jgi:hypothetical protein
MLFFQQLFCYIIYAYQEKGFLMKKILLLLGAIITFVFSGTGEIKEINDTLQHGKGNFDGNGEQK